MRPRAAAGQPREGVRQGMGQGKGQAGAGQLRAPKSRQHGALGSPREAGEEAGSGCEHRTGQAPGVQFCGQR